MAKYTEDAAKLLDLVGGKENISAVTHCMTRMRFVLVDEGKADVSYDAELDSVLRKMDEKKHDLAIILNDPSLEKIWDLSMIGKRMPKKTTFFFPKIWSGFVFYRMF